MQRRQIWLEEQKKDNPATDHPWPGEAEGETEERLQ